MKTWAKKKPLLAFVMAGLMSLLMFTSGCTGSSKTKSIKVELSPDEVSSVVYYKDNSYLVTAGSNLITIDNMGNQLYSFDLLGCIEGMDLQENPRFFIVDEFDGGNVWVSTSNCLLRLREQNGVFKLTDSFALKDGLYALTEKDGYVYVLERDVNFGWLKKFDLTKKFSEGPVSSGHLYAPSQTGQEITLKLARNVSVLSFEIIEKDGVEYAYILHRSGLFRIATDCSQNKWYEIFRAKQAEIYAELYLNNEADTENDLQLQANRLAEEAIIEEYDEVEDFDSASGKVTLEASAFDKNLYNCYSSGDVSYTGCVYMESENKYYITTEGLKVITCDLGQDFSTKNKRQIFNLPLEYEETDIAELEKSPTDRRDALFYDKVNNVAYVLHEWEELFGNTSTIEFSGISLIDFNTKETSYLGEFDSCVVNITPSADGESIFYCQFEDEGYTLSLYRVLIKDIR